MRFRPFLHCASLRVIAPSAAAPTAARHDPTFLADLLPGLQAKLSPPAPVYPCGVTKASLPSALFRAEGLDPIRKRRARNFVNAPSPCRATHRDGFRARASSACRRRSCDSSPRGTPASLPAPAASRACRDVTNCCARNHRNGRPYPSVPEDRRVPRQPAAARSARSIAPMSSSSVKGFSRTSTLLAESGPMRTPVAACPVMKTMGIPTPTRSRCC